MGIKLKEQSGQMTVEFVAVFPLFIIIAVMAVNALLFFSECAAFDRLAQEAIRIHASSPAYEQTSEQTCAQIEQMIHENFEKDYLSCSVEVTGNVWGQMTYTCTLSFSPTLFGMGLRSSVFGVPLPSFEHRVSLTVDPYRSGILL